MKRIQASLLIGLYVTTLAGVPAATALAAEKEREILYWVAPMDPNYRRDKPGKSPMGMDLIPVYADEQGKNEGPGITIPPEVTQSLGVRTAKVERSRLWRGIETVGYVDYDESRVSHIHLRTEGWIEKLTVRSVGERVHKGQRLFNLYSPELVNAQEEFIQALRAKHQRRIRASRERLLALGLTRQQVRDIERDRRVRQTVAIHATQDGVVAKLDVRDGMFVKPANRVMSLADLSSVWVLADVFERQVDWVRLNQPAEVELSFLPGQSWEGRVEYIYPSLDPKTRTLKVRLRFDNPEERLKPNMYANIHIYGGPKDNVLIVPREALIRSGRENRLVIALGEGRFESRVVKPGIESGDWVEIMDGVKEGEEVVVSAQFLIDSEASLKASMTRMEPAEPEQKPMQMDMQKDTGKVVEGRGRIEAVLGDARKLTLAHEPIKALGWPSMTMDFAVAKDVDLSQLKAGDEIRFTLEKQGERYVITGVEQAGKGGQS